MMFLLRLNSIVWFRRCMHNHFRKEFGRNPIKIACPLFVVIHTHRQAYRTIIMFGKIRKALTCIDLIAIIAEMIFTCFRRTLITDGISGTVYSAGAAFITKFRNSGINRMVDCHRK